MPDDVQRLLASLLGAKYFEDAAAAAVEPLLRIAAEALASSPFGREGRILRAIVHLRPGETYTNLAVVESRTASALRVIAEEEAQVPSLASATAWRSLMDHRCALSIDINLGTVEAHVPGAVAKPNSQVGTRVFTNEESRLRFLGRQASHVCALPLRAPGGAIEGMISLEAECRAAMGLKFIWGDCSARLQLLADIAAPFLDRLPARPVHAAETDELLPVVGAAIAKLMPILQVFAQQEETIRISGPTGSGKSRLARWCHSRSARRNGPFEVLDLVTVPDELQMAELFGWKKGAFTGAIRDSQGSVARAEGGTLFIDEIDKLTLKAQAGLLHVLEERAYRPLGDGSEERRADVRFIIGSNADLPEAMRQGRFREDLYYRINVLPIRLPPLQERRDEIPMWARYMVQRRHRDRSPEGVARLTPEAERLLSSSPWPGNLRQLDNIIRRVYALALVGRGSDERDVLLEREHVAEALQYETPAGAPRSLVDVLCTAAEAFVSEAERRRGAPMDLDLVDAFRGFVLGMAARRVGRDEAFRLFDRGKLVASRNHHRTLRRELERVEALCEVLGTSARSPFDDLAASVEDNNSRTQ